MVAVCAVAVGVVLFFQFGSGRDSNRSGPIEHEVRSDYSHIRIRRQENVRTLLFVEGASIEETESKVDLHEPHKLMLPYTRFMFASYLFAPQQQRALIVGLGGGAMVHFLKHFDADLHLDVVEIDPVVVQLADEYFDVRTGGNVRIINQDALELLKDDGPRYDAIYMDAFLGASDATDATGIPLHLKTAEFFKTVQSRLSPDGLVVFNLHRHRNHDEDVRNIRAAFGQAYVFRVPGLGNVIVVATMSPSRLSREELQARAAALDETVTAGFSFGELLKSMGQ